jgi:hypothetical protein
MVRDGHRAPGNNWLFMYPGCIQQPLVRTYPEFCLDLVMISQANGRFVAAENSGGTYLIANRTAIGPWERFGIIGQLTHGQTISLRPPTASGSAQRVVAAINANRNWASTWETFTVIKLNGGIGMVGEGDPFALRTYDGYHFWCAESFGWDPLNATRTAVAGWETFMAHFEPRPYP